MADVPRRFQELSADRRKLLEQLLKANVVEKAAAQPAINLAPAILDSPELQYQSRGLELQFSSSCDQVKQNFRVFYNSVSEQLDLSLFGKFSYFLNYGFVPNGSPEWSAFTLPEKYLNKNSVRLVLEVIGNCDLKDQRILDVGCGRGGTIYTIQQFFQPKSMLGLDLSKNAIDFCNRVHRYPNVSFREGDAEKLPFADSCFDVVTNVESSHTYPNVRSFYLETSRVLAARGVFLYADVMPRDKSNECLGMLQRLGFTVEQDRDITNNAVLSCDEVASSRTQVFRPGNDPGLINNFLAAPSSPVYEEMKSGNWVYRILKLRKGNPKNLAERNVAQNVYPWTT